MKQFTIGPIHRMVFAPGINLDSDEFKHLSKLKENLIKERQTMEQSKDHIVLINGMQIKGVEGYSTDHKPRESDSNDSDITLPFGVLQVNPHAPPLEYVCTKEQAVIEADKFNNVYGTSRRSYVVYGPLKDQTTPTFSRNWLHLRQTLIDLKHENVTALHPATILQLMDFIEKGPYHELQKQV